jgi:uncharacterized protein
MDDVHIKISKIIEFARLVDMCWICSFKNMGYITQFQFDPTNIDELEEKKLEEVLKTLKSNTPWSVKNEARMHIKSKMPPYSSSVDAISKFPETATALGVKLDEKDNLVITAPCGISDVVNLEVKPTPFFTETKERVEIYEDRITKKNWKSTWHNLKVYHINNSY